MYKNTRRKNADIKSLPGRTAVHSPTGHGIDSRSRLNLPVVSSFKQTDSLE